MDSEKKDQKETPMDEEGAASTSEAAASTSEAAASTSEAAASSSEAAASSSEAAASTSEAAASTSEGTGSPEAAASTSTRVPKKAWTTADTHNAINEFVNRIDLWMRHKVPHFPYQLPEEMDEPEKRTEDDQYKK